MTLQELILINKEWLDDFARQQQTQYADDANIRITTSSRTIVHDGRYIYLYLRSSNIIVYIDFAEALFRFLANKSLCSYVVNDRGRVQVELLQYRYGTGDTYAPVLSRYLYFYYFMEQPARQLADNFAQISARERAYSVDHVNSNIYMDTRWNLASIPARENGQKNTLAARIKPPYYMYPYVMEDGTYRVKYGYIAPTENVIEGWGNIVKCNTNADLCDFVRTFLEVQEVPPVLERFGTPKECYVAHKNGTYFADGFVMAERVWREVSALDDDKICAWRAQT